jgi:hypothetical protein
VSVLALSGVLLSAGEVLGEATCASYAGDLPLVVLALDGVPYAVIEQARAEGAFGGWPETRALIAPFPSMTNVSFAAIFAPLGVEPIAGYEIPHFDRRRNAMVGKSPFGAKKRSYGWRSVVEKGLIGLWGHTVGYAAPRHKALVELAEVEGQILAAEREVLIVYLAATDSLTHFRGYDGLLRFLHEMDRRLAALQRRYLEQKGRCLRLVMLSDHGNTEQKVRRVEGLRRRLERSGFRVRSRLRRPEDIVAPTFGLCNYGVLYVASERAARAAAAVAAHPHVELAAFVAAEERITVVTAETSASLSWRPGGEGRRFRYEPESGDPLALSAAVARLRAEGQLDGEGFARGEDWLVASADATYPDAPRRIVDALTGTHVENVASVVFSIEPGRAWGRKAGYFGARLKGGLLEGTHGGLDAGSTRGFFLVNDPALDPGRLVSAAEALDFLTTDDGGRPVLGGTSPKP